MHLVLNLPCHVNSPTMSLPWTRSLLYPLFLVDFEAKSIRCFGRLKMFKLWQLFLKHPQLLLVTSMHGYHLCNTLYNFHVLHVPTYPYHSYFHLIFYHIQYFSTRSLAPLLAFVFLLSSLIFTKPSVEMIATLCNNHLPLRSFPKNLFLLSLKEHSQKPYYYSFPDLSTK